MKVLLGVNNCLFLVLYDEYVAWPSTLLASSIALAAARPLLACLDGCLLVGDAWLTTLSKVFQLFYSNKNTFGGWIIQ